LMGKIWDLTTGCPCAPCSWAWALLSKDSITGTNFAYVIKLIM
jgi:hypothetical protein